MKFSSNPTGAVLLAHGSSNPEAGPELQALCRQTAENLAGWQVAEAYLNHAPGLLDAVNRLRQSGCGRIEVFPLLVFQGKHLKEDLPALIKEAEQEFPGLRIELHPHLFRAPGFASWLAGAMAQANQTETQN